METQDNSLRAFFNHITDFLFILDLNGNIKEVNTAVTSLLGYSQDELRGMSVLMVHPPEFRERAGKTVKDMLAGKCEACPIPLLSKDNRHIPVETRVYPGTWNNEQVLIGLSRNLSELALSEEKFREVFNNSMALMVISEIETGIIVDVNKQFLNTLGYSKEEVVGKRSKDLNLYEDYSLRNIMLQRLTKNEPIENEEQIILTKSGERIYCEVTVSGIQIQTHNYVLTSCSNINQLKLTENRLKNTVKQRTLLADIANSLNSVHEIEKKLDGVLWLIGRYTELSHIMIVEDDDERRVSTITYEWHKKDIKPLNENQHNISYDLIPSWKTLLDIQGKILCTDIEGLPDDLKWIMKSSDVKSFLAFPLYVREKMFGSIGFYEFVENRKWELNEVEFLRAISNIISNTFERIIIQKQLSESEQQLKLAIDNTETGLWDWEIPTGKVFYNDMWCRMLGYEKEEIEPSVKTWERLVHPDDMPLINIKLEEHFSGKTEIYETTHRLLTKSGTWKWIIDKGKVTERDRNGKPLRAIGTHTDIDVLKKIESELRIANATKEKLLSIIAHDLRGPIGTLAQISETIGKAESMDQDTLSHFLSSQEEISRSTYQLLDNLLNWATINKDKIRYIPKRLDLNNIIREHVNNIKFQADKKKIDISLETSGSNYVFADEDLVRLIIRNLLTNAIKFTPSKGKIKIETSDNADHVRIAISDTGIGISEENLKIILSEDKFLSTFGTENEKGTGIGLKLCTNFITVNKGEFEIKSKVNQGTTFIFTLPNG